MATRLEKVWIGESFGKRELRLDWSNDRHHAVTIEFPNGPKQVANALLRLSVLVHKDVHLGVLDGN